MEEREKETAPATTCFSCELQPELLRQGGCSFASPSPPTPSFYPQTSFAPRPVFPAALSPSVSLFVSNPSPPCTSENQAVASSQGTWISQLK